MNSSYLKNAFNLIVNEKFMILLFNAYLTEKIKPYLVTSGSEEN